MIKLDDNALSFKKEGLSTNAFRNIPLAPLISRSIVTPPDRAVFAGTGSSVTAPPYDTTQIRARSRRFARPIRVTIRRPSTIDYTGLLNADPPAGAFPGVSWADVGRNRWWSTSVLGVPPQVTVQNPNNLTYLGLKTGFWFNNPLYATYVNSSAALVRVPVLFNYTVQVRITNEFKHPW